MAALVLSIAGAAAGSAVLGPIGAIVGRLVGAVAGNAIDQALFGARRNVSLEGPRLSDLSVMASTEGAAIPRVYGRARLSGQVIWATNLKATNTYICGHKCPLWVISGQAITAQIPPLSALVQKRTNSGAVGLSAKCHKQTFPK